MYAGRFRQAWSEDKLQRSLQDASRIQHAGDNSRGGRSDGGGGGRERGSVGDVERLRAELQALRFANEEILFQGHVELLQAVGAQNIAPAVAVGVARRNREGGRI